MNNEFKKYIGKMDRLMASGQTLEDIFKLSMEGKKESAIEYLDQNNQIVSITYLEYLKMVKATACEIEKSLSEIPNNAIVALKIANSPRFGVLFFALLMSGFEPFLLDARESTADSDLSIKRADVKAIIVDHDEAFEIPSFRVDKLYADSISQEPIARWADTVWFRSSGTTGDPKIVGFTGSNLAHEIEGARIMPDETPNIIYPLSLGKTRNLALLPFHHIFGFTAVFLWYTFLSGTIFYTDKRLPSEIMPLVRKAGITHVFAVPLFWNAVYRQIENEKRHETELEYQAYKNMISYHIHLINKEKAEDGASNGLYKETINSMFGKTLRYAISGGGYLSTETLASLNGLGIPLHNGYGMTEIGVTSVDLNEDIDKRILGSVGHPLYGVEYLRNNDGELLVKAPQLPKYKIKDGQKVLNDYPNGFFSTQDIVSEKDGLYYINGRIKDVIIGSNGENVYPDEIEDHFNHLPKVKNVSVLGINGDKDNVYLVLILEAQESDVTELLKTKIRETNYLLPSYKRIQKVFYTTNPLPLANRMKPERNKIKIELSAGHYQPLDITVRDENLMPNQDFDQTMEEIKAIFASHLGINPENIGSKSHFVVDLGGDSLSYIAVVNDIEEKFDVKLSDEDCFSLYTVFDFASFVSSYNRQ